MAQKHTDKIPAGVDGKVTPTKLTDAEMLEAMEPLEKQLGSLNQIHEGIAAYFQARDERQAVIKQRDELVTQCAQLTAERDEMRISNANEINVNRRSIEEKRMKGEIEYRDVMTKRAHELREAEGRLSATRQALTNMNKQVEEREKELAAELVQKTREHNEKIAAMDAESNTAATALETLQKSFEAFVREHGMNLNPLGSKNIPLAEEIKTM